jgi:hypothetical protein
MRRFPDAMQGVAGGKLLNFCPDWWKLRLGQELTSDDRVKVIWVRKETTDASITLLTVR